MHKKYHQVVVKIGTNVITKEDGSPDVEVFQNLVMQIAKLRKLGLDITVVTSGAVGAGRLLIKHPVNSTDVVKRQVLASVGQIKLMNAYMSRFQELDQICAQVLVTKEDFRDRKHYLNMRNCLQGLLHQKVIPVVNENDVISIDELMFTDNDELAGLIASMMQVDALILLTSVDGIYDGHPRDKNAQLISIVDVETGSLKKYISEEKSSFGRGGMLTKSNIAFKLAAVGIATHIANGKTANVLLDIVEKKSIGTQFLPFKNTKTSSLKRWIAHSEGYEKGVIYVNRCAESVLKEKISSLLPVGVIKIDGEFEKGDVVQICNEKKEKLGFGLASYNSKKAREFLGQKGKKQLIHYDYLFIQK